MQSRKFCPSGRDFLRQIFLDPEARRAEGSLMLYSEILANLAFFEHKKVDIISYTIKGKKVYGIEQRAKG